jgi:hypothetical protein
VAAQRGVICSQVFFSQGICGVETFEPTVQAPINPNELADAGAPCRGCCTRTVALYLAACEEAGLTVTTFAHAKGR